MATVTQIVDGVETRLKTILGLNVTDYVPEQVNPPQAFVDVPGIPDYRKSFSPTGLRTIDLTVTILVSAAYVGHQKLLLPYIDKTGSQSVYAAIEADKTLGLTNVECLVRSYQRLGLQEVGLIGYYGGVFTLTCIATG